MNEDNTSIVIHESGRSLSLIRPIANPIEIAAAHREAVALIQKVLEEGRDYGEVPGTGKPTLLKPGAERLSIAFGAYPSYEIIEKEIDHDRVNTFTGWDSAAKPASKTIELEMKANRRGRWKKIDGEWSWQEKQDGATSCGMYRYVIRCRLKIRQSEEVIAEGIGSCSTLESKYIDRPRDCENTVLKMAEKRAFVAATLHAFGLSDRFTQDMEDVVSEPHTPNACDPKIIHKSLHLSKDQDKDVKAACRDMNRAYQDVLIEAWEEGVRTAAELMAFVATQPDVDEETGEIIEAQPEDKEGF